MRVLKVYGPPGTGKTHHLIEEVKRYLLRYYPDEVGFFSYTRAAAGEAKRRAILAVECDPKELQWFGTLHSCAFRLLGLDRDEVMTDRKFYEFCKEIGIEAEEPRDEMIEKIEYYYDYFDFLNTKAEGNKILGIYNYAREKMVSYQDAYNSLAYLEGEIPDLLTFKYVIEKYEQYKHSQGLLDFVDFMERCIKENLSPDLKVVILDEAQDCSKLEFTFFKMIAANADEVIICGDDDQAIYDYKGVDPQDFINIEGKDLVLDTSYRVPIAIWKKAIQLIERNKMRKEKLYLPCGEIGEVKFVNSIDDIPFVELEGTTFVLARNWIWLKPLSEMLKYRGLLYNIAGFEQIYRQELRRAILCAWDMVQGKRVSGKSLKALFKFLPASPYLVRGAKSKAKSIKSEDSVGPDVYKPFFQNGVLERWVDPLKIIDDLKFQYKEHYKYVIKTQGIDILNEDPRINLGTIHWSKGQEADNVVLLPDQTYRTFRWGMIFPEAERRVFYVGITRAKQRLFILSPDNKYFFEELFW